MKKLIKIASIFVVAIVLLAACKNEAKKDDAKKEITTVKTEKLNLNISGMTCEIGCAKTIQSKLSKKEGIASAKVIFKDSLAVIEYDATKTNKKDIISFVNGIADGKLYTATETDRVAKSCGPDCKKPCCASKDKKVCKKGASCKKGADCKKGKECTAAKKDACKKASKCTHKTKEECAKAGCDKKASCNKKDCKKASACDKKDKATCKPGCTKPCCAKKEKKA